MTDDYNTLPVEDSWVAYIRTRLPYSFKRIQAMNRHSWYQLNDPELLQDAPFSSAYHNYWKRGNIFYIMGKIGDCHGLFDAGSYIRRAIEEPVESEVSGPLLPVVLPISHDVWTTLQSEKMWRQARSHILERERVAMSNVFQGIELCLKAVTVHARYRENGAFSFSATHDVNALFEGLPTALRDEMVEESAEFAVDYYEYQTKIVAEVKEISKRHSLAVRPDLSPWEPLRQEWMRLLQQMDSTPYTVHSNGPDVSVLPTAAKDWLANALDHLKSVEGMDRGTYFRYAPLHDADELPVNTLNKVLLLGRFLYEYLFPVPQSA